MASRGHRITIITAKPGKPMFRRLGNLSIHYHAYLQHPLFFGKNNRLRYHLFFFSCLSSFLGTHYDVIHNLWYSDSFAAAVNNYLRKTRYILNINSPPTSDFSVFKNNRLDKFMLRQAVKRASRILSTSAYVRDCLKREIDLDSQVVHFPVNTAFFRPVSSRDRKRPFILYSGSLNDPRKGLEILIKAFCLIRQKNAAAVLQLSGQVDPHRKTFLSSLIPPGYLDSVHFLGPGHMNDLPRLYSEASVTVLPSVFEAQGAVLNESLACGTPVVGTNSGGIPEIISHPGIGRLFIPDNPARPTNAEDLSRAINEALELAQESGIESRCREHAMSFSWEALGPRIEQEYYSALDATRPSS